MSKWDLLPVTIQTQLNNGDVKVRFVLEIDGTNYTSYLVNWSIDTSKEFGSMSATFVLNNDSGIFGEDGSEKIEVGDTVEFNEYFTGSTKEFPKFYGQVNQRSIMKTAQDRTITLVCLDFISSLQFMDIDLEVEGEKIKVEEEILTPNYLPAPNQSLAQIFDFANNSIADNPLPIISIRNKNTAEEDPQYDGYDMIYAEGQLKLGFPLNAMYNYDLVAVSYYFYVKGVYAEDIIEDILIEPDGYGNYLFGETTAQAVITNHLTETKYNVDGTNTDTLIPNYTPSEITVETIVTAHDYDPEASGGVPTYIEVESTAGFPNSGTGSVNGDAFTWTGKTLTRLTGIPVSGVYSLNYHAVGSYVKYTTTYLVGQVWYLSYSNVVTNLSTSDFTIGGAVVNYFDKRFGRIILNSPKLTSATITCNTNYSFKTLQASGIELNRIVFHSREVENRLEAVKKVKEYLAPNYIIRTKGDSKIWANYLSQKVNEDYTLKLATSINYMEDQDLYTRVIFFGKNKNPTNLMMNEGVAFVGTGQSYKAIATASILSSIREEDNYYVYGSPVSGVGRIITNSIKPRLYINEVQVDDTSHVIAGQQVVVEVTTKTETTVSGGGK